MYHYFIHDNLYSVKGTVLAFNEFDGYKIDYEYISLNYKAIVNYLPFLFSVEMEHGTYIHQSEITIIQGYIK